MSIGSRLKGFLDLGGRAQFLLAIFGALGINLGTAWGVGKAVAPVTGADYVLLAAVFMATTPISFPLSALGMNLALARVENSRRKNLFDDPVETARKRIEALIVEGQALYGDMPDTVTTTRDQQSYHGDRSGHWILRADAELRHTAGRYASAWFMADAAEDNWQLSRLATWESTRKVHAAFIERLRTIRERLPIDRTKYLRYSLSLDITAGRALARYLDSPPEGSGEGHGIRELAAWASGVWNVFQQEASEHMHLFAPETYADLPTAAERAAYVLGRVSELERISKAL